jgi:hypothetical protein
MAYNFNPHDSGHSYEDLIIKYHSTYPLTHRLIQDCLDNYFSQIRTGGWLHDLPSPSITTYALQIIMLGKNPGVVSKHTNMQINRYATEREGYCAKCL